MRILQVLRPSAGGMVRATELLVHGLRDQGLISDIVGADFIPSKPHLFQDRRAAQQIKEIAENYDIIHAHGYRGAWITGLALGNQKKWLWTAHNLYEPKLLPIANWIATQVLRRITQKAQANIAVSHAVFDSLNRNHIQSTTSEIIYGGIDFTPYETPIQKTDARKKLSLPQDIPIISVIGRLSFEKGQDLAIASMEKVWKKHPHAIMLIVGDGKELSALREQASRTSRSNQIRFLGFFDPLQAIYYASDLVCVPSRSEGLGLVAIEALACGIPVAAFDVGGLNEIIIHGQTGCLVPPNSIEKLAKEMRKLIASPDICSSYGEAGKKRVHDLFNICDSINKTIALYKRIAENL